MKKNIVLLLMAFITLAAYGQKSPKEILENTTATFKKAGGIETSFNIKVFSNGSLSGEAIGVIKLKGEKFILETTDAITWFDGETQWTYLINSEEVNITNPTEEELQEINPYALLNIYHQGYNTAMGKAKAFKSKPISEVILTATNKKQNLQTITLYIDNNYRPVYIEAKLGDGSRNEITVTGYKTGEKYKDALFVFDEKKYPEAEIIDLR